MRSLLNAKRLTPYFSLRYGVAIIILTLTFFLQFLGDNVILNRIDGIAYDAKLTVMSPLPDSTTNIQIVDIDERSLFEIERMPWRRDLYAALANELTRMGAIVIAFDVLFSEPQANPAAPVLERLLELDKLESLDDPMVQSTVSAFDYDRIFSAAIADKEIVLGTLLHQQSALQKGVIENKSITQTDSPLSDNVPNFIGYAGIVPRIAKHASGLGFMNSVEDNDGFVRSAALIAKVNDEIYPSLALETFRVYSLVENIEPIWQTHNDLRFLTGIKIGTHIVPTDNQGRVLIPFKGPAKTYPYISAADVLMGSVEPERFDQAVVFIGTSASGLADLRVTPVAVNFPGVEIHATVFDALLHPQDLIYRPDWWQGAIAIQLVLVGLIVVLTFPRLGPVATVLATSAVLLIVVTTNLVLWRYYSIDLPVVSPLVLAMLLSIYFIAAGFFSESQRRKQVKAIFDQYVPPAHIDRLLNSPKNITLAGEKKELTVMFSDIRSFTTISETMSAQALKQWLNQFFSPITKVIFQHDGTIDKYVGDMVMAFWGAPLDDPQHANKSIKAAFQMLNALEILNLEFNASQQPQANIGIGINTGEMNVGDMGSDYRRSYTVIGDAVNLGSRLEGLTKFYGLTILVSEYTKKQASEFEFLMIDKVKVKGKSKPVTIYSPLPKDSSKDETALDDIYNKAIDAFFKAEFQTALPLFQSLLSQFRYPILIELYVQRTLHYVSNPPGLDWDGSYTHTAK